MKPLAKNKQASFDYDIKDRFEAGLELFGHEVKSVKTGQASLKGAYVTMHGNEAFLINAHIPPYKFAGELPGYDPYRSRKLLLHKKELDYLIGKTKEQGLAIVPLKMYTKKGRVKLGIGIGRGKKKFDKRESIKKREVDRKIRRAMKDSY